MAKSLRLSLENLARKLRAGKLSEKEYEAEVDHLLGTELPERNLEQEEAWENSKTPQSPDSEVSKKSPKGSKLLH